MEDLRASRAKGRLAVVAMAATAMLVAPLALLHGGAAPAAATAAASGGRTSGGTAAADLGATQLVSANAPAMPPSAAVRARHHSAVRHNLELQAAARRRLADRRAGDVRNKRAAERLD